MVPWKVCTLIQHDDTIFLKAFFVTHYDRVRLDNKSVIRFFFNAVPMYIFTSCVSQCYILDYRISNTLNYQLCYYDLLQLVSTSKFLATATHCRSLTCTLIDHWTMQSPYRKQQVSVTNKGRKREDHGNEVDSPVDIQWMNQINIVKNIIRKMKQDQYNVQF